MSTVKNMPPEVANQFDERFVLWMQQYIVNIVNQTIEDLSDTDDSISSLSTTKADSDHNHNLNDLTEKSYGSLTDKPVASAADDGPTDVAAITSPSCASGTDQINRTAFNAVLSTLETEINGVITALNSLKAAHNDIIDELQSAGLMS